MKQRGKILAVITSCVLVLSSSSVVYSSAASDNIKTDVISEELREIMNNSNDSELIPVGIKLTDLDGAIINEMIEAESCYDTFLYQDIETYKSLVAPSIVKEAEEKYGFELAHLLTLRNSETDDIIYSADTYFDYSTVKGKMLADMSYDMRADYIVANVSDDDKQKCADNNFGMSYITKEISDDIDGYMKVRRNCVIRAYEEHNQNFISKYVPSERVLTNFSFAPYLIVEANKKTIYDIASDKSVIGISHFVNEELQPSLSDSNILTGVTASQSSSYNDGNGYTGVGVGIGIIEAASGRYRSNYGMLSNCSNLSFITTNGDNGNTNRWHATRVTSIIKGKTTYENGVRYRGVSPDAIVYQTCCNNSSNMEQTIRILASNGVSIINHSANLNTSHSYSEYDWLIDQAINNLGIVGSSAALVEHNLVKDIHMYLFHVPLDNEPLSMRYSVSEAAADESLLPCIQPITSTSHCKVAFAA